MNEPIDTSYSTPAMSVAFSPETHVRAILSPEEIDWALDPGRYLGSTDAFIDRTFASYRHPLFGPIIVGGNWK